MRWPSEEMVGQGRSIVVTRGRKARKLAQKMEEGTREGTFDRGKRILKCEVTNGTKTSQLSRRGITDPYPQ